jgi:hypothetical protein
MWLAASERNIAVHPMTALPYFFARLMRGGGAGFEPYMIEQLRSLRARYEGLFQLTFSVAEVLLFRVGFCDTTTKRSLRRPVDDVLTILPHAVSTASTNAGLAFGAPRG